MAKITLIIEDKPDNKVSVTVDPKVETIFKMIESGEDMTSAHGYAMRAVNSIKEASDENGPNKIYVPRRAR